MTHTAFSKELKGANMAGTGASSPYIKDEPEEFFSPNQRFISGQQAFSMHQQPQQFGHYGSHGGSINPSDLSMGGGNGVAVPSYGNNFGAQTSGQGHMQQKGGMSMINDDELLDSLGSNDYNGLQPNGGHDFEMDFNSNGYHGTPALSIDPNHMNGMYSNTPDGDPIQSPFVRGNFNQTQFTHQVQQQHFGSSLQSPASYNGSPHPGMHIGSVDSSYKQQRPRLMDAMQGRKSSNTRSPITPKTPTIERLNIGPSEHGHFGSQPIRTSHSHRHQKSLSGQFDQTPSSLNSFGDSNFSSPLSQGMHPNPGIADILKGTSMPAKLSNGHPGSAPALQSQEMKRRRRRESHNLVERRRRDNINERIQELSHLVPLHRLEDEKVRKALQNNSPLSPSLVATSGLSPPQATSSLAGPGARRAAGNITTGIPIEEKDKGPNKGDILNGAVSWTRDLMWMLHLKIQQQEELANLIADLGGEYPFSTTEEERRMQTELMDAMIKNDSNTFAYSRHPGSGLRVPKHTDVKGEVLGGDSSSNPLDTSVSPDNHSTGDAGQAGMGGPGQYWSGHNSGGSGPGSIGFKEEDEYGMDLGV